jgi:hypothetical protein
MVSSPTLLDADRHTSQMHKQSNFFEDSSDPSRFRKKNQQYFTKARWMTCVPIGKLLASSVSLLTVSSTFDLLFKVLFTFPSLYVFAIGLPDIFSFR